MAFTNVDIEDYELSAGKHCRLARENFENATMDFEQYLEDTLFHCAQCVEIILKTLILAYGYQPPRDRDLFTHDIVALWGLYTVTIQGNVIPSEYIIDLMPQMKDWSVNTRYHPFDFDLKDLAALVEDVEQFYYDAYDFLEGF